MRTDAEVTAAVERTARITLALVATRRERDHARDIACALEAELARRHRCPVCRIHVDHEPGGEDCRAYLDERRWKLAE